jgi:ribosomal protein S18 acetylase RimI-like enzyme
MRTIDDQLRSNRTPGSNPEHATGSAIRRASTDRDWSQAHRLLCNHAAWIEAETGVSMLEAQPDLVAELADLRGAYGSDGSVLLVADDGDQIVGIVAVRHHDDGSAELKRMYVDPSARGHGHASRLVDEAISHAERIGVAHLWLETLPGVMDRAISMYRSHGFRHVAAEPHIDIDAAIVMTRELGGTELP